MTELVPRPAVVEGLVLDGAGPATAGDARMLLAGFLAGYSARTREAYEVDLRQWGRWLEQRGIPVLAAQRRHVQVWAAELEELGRAPSTIARKLSAVAGFYAYAVVEEAIGKSPASHVRRPKVSAESNREGLEREELDALLAAAEQAGPVEHALVCLLALNGLRISEACRARPCDRASNQGHQVLSGIGKGSKPFTVPLARRTARALDELDAARPGLADVPYLGMNRFQAERVFKRLAAAAGITKHVTPHSARHTFVTLALDAGVPLHLVQDAARHADPRTTQRYNRHRNALDQHATYAVAALFDEPAAS